MIPCLRYKHVKRLLFYHGVEPRKIKLQGIFKKSNSTLEIPEFHNII